MCEQKMCSFLSKHSRAQLLIQLGKFFAVDINGNWKVFTRIAVLFYSLVTMTRNPVSTSLEKASVLF